MPTATPESFTANDVITPAFADCGLIAENDTLEAAQAQDGLARLNRFISQLKTQEFSVPFIGREVFEITANQNTYTIGPGGDFDTQRPQLIRGAGLILGPTIAAFTITGVSTSARTFTVAGDQTGSFLSGSDFSIAGSTGNDGNYTIVSSVYSTSTTVTVLEAVLSAVADGTITVFAESSSTVEIPIGVLTDNAYQAIQVKQLGNTQWTQVYYNPTFAGGLGQIFLWPNPNTAVNALALYLDQLINGFANLTTTYYFPPGYADLFEYGLANRLLGPYGVKDPDIKAEVKTGLLTASTLVKRTNVKFNDMPIDSASIGSDGGLYNILTGGVTSPR
jgi:hypothetical protein